MTLTVGRPPLEAIAEVALSDPSLTSLAIPLFDAYERFLSLLDDDDRRTALEKLGRDAADDDPAHEMAEDIGTAFGVAVENFFFDGPYARAIRSFGVF